MKKTCTKCGKTRLRKFFYKGKIYRDGLHPWCKVCVNAHNREYRLSHIEETKRRAKKYNSAHTKEIKAYRKKYMLKHKEQQKRRLKRFHLKNPEYVTVRGHFYSIKTSKRDKDRTYKGMPFYTDWNPKEGGSLLAGANWIAANLGHRPKGCTLHIIEHEKGFVPGNLEWTYPQKQSNQRMFMVIAQLKHRIKELEQQLKDKK